MFLTTTRSARGSICVGISGSSFVLCLCLDTVFEFSTRAMRVLAQANRSAGVTSDKGGAALANTELRNSANGSLIGNAAVQGEVCQTVRFAVAARAARAQVRADQAGGAGYRVAENDGSARGCGRDIAR